LPPKKRRKSIPNNEDEDDDNDGGEQNPTIVVDDKVVEQGNLARMSMLERTTDMKTNSGEEVDDVGGNPFHIENDCEGVHRLENRLRKKRRRYIRISEDDDAEADTSGQNLVGAEDGHFEVTQVATPKVCGWPKVNFCSEPIDIPTWRCDIFLCRHVPRPVTHWPATAAGFHGHDRALHPTGLCPRATTAVPACPSYACSELGTMERRGLGPAVARELLQHHDTTATPQLGQ
jgi:translation initiation factor IF-1